MKQALIVFGSTIGICVAAGVFAGIVWFPFAERFPKAADVIKKIAIAVAIFAALSYVVNDIDEKSKKRQEEHDQEIWNEAYSSGQNSVIENPGDYIDFSDAYADGYNDGFYDGWYSCNDGYPIE